MEPLGQSRGRDHITFLQPPRWEPTQGNGNGGSFARGPLCNPQTPSRTCTPEPTPHASFLPWTRLLAVHQARTMGTWLPPTLLTPGESL